LPLSRSCSAKYSKNKKPKLEAEAGAGAGAEVMFLSRWRDVSPGMKEDSFDILSDTRTRSVFQLGDVQLGLRYRVSGSIVGTSRARDGRKTLQI